MPTRHWEVTIGETYGGGGKVYPVTGKTTPTALHRGAIAHIKAGFRIRQGDRITVRRTADPKPTKPAKKARKRKGT